MDNPLPPGQKDISSFPRYGLWQFASAIDSVQPLCIRLTSENSQEALIFSEDLESLERVKQISDFHCVTTWSARNLRWEGYRFKQFYEFALNKLQSSGQYKFAVFRSDDGYRTYMYLEDLLKEDVLLADTLNEEALCLDHGGPVRLVAPAHYGFKNAKHVKQIHFCNDLRGYRSPAFHWHESPRARVALEERGWPSAKFWRFLGALVIPSVLYVFQRAKSKREKKRKT